MIDVHRAEKGKHFMCVLWTSGRKAQVWHGAGEIIPYGMLGCYRIAWAYAVSLMLDVLPDSIHGPSPGSNLASPLNLRAGQWIHQHRYCLDSSFIELNKRCQFAERGLASGVQLDSWQLQFLRIRKEAPCACVN